MNWIKKTWQYKKLHFLYWFAEILLLGYLQKLWSSKLKKSGFQTPLEFKEITNSQNPLFLFPIISQIYDRFWAKEKKSMKENHIERRFQEWSGYKGK